MSDEPDTPPPSRRGSNGADKVSLRDYFDQALRHQTEILRERAGAHGQEHLIHEEAHKREHSEAKEAIRVATTALDKRLDVIEGQFHTDMDGISKQIQTLDSDRVSARGYILGVGAVLGLLVLIANFALPLVLNP